MSHPAIIAHHLARLQAPAWRPRAQAARLLAPYAAQPPVWEALAARVAQDPNLAVRIQALRSLARSGRPESLPILEAAVASGPEPLQEHGLSGLAEWGVAAGREEEAFRRLLERIECCDDPEGLRRRGVALYALGELEVAGVEATLDRFVTAQEPVVAGGAWSSLAYQKRREVLPQLLERVATAPDEWTHDQALKTVRLLADVQTRYYQVPWSDDAGWLAGMQRAFPPPLQPQTQELVDGLVAAWQREDYPGAAARLAALADRLVAAFGRYHGRWNGAPDEPLPDAWLWETDPVTWARFQILRAWAHRPHLFAGRWRRWAQEELRTAVACFLETTRRLNWLHRAWTGQAPPEAASPLGHAVWALDADQERPPYRRLTLLSRQGREALPALRAFLADPLATHGHLWAAELLARLGEPEDLDRFLALATDPWVGEAAQAGAAAYGAAALTRVSGWLRQKEEDAWLAAVGVASRIPLPESWLLLGERLPQAEGPRFHALVAGLVRLGGAAALERLIEAGRTLDGERARLAQQGAVYLAHWEELTHLLPAEWAEVPPLAPLPDAPAVGVHEFDVYTTPDQPDPDPSDPRLPEPPAPVEPGGA
ncbi:HEAT repeat domain-containing protein [Limnochorda sp.]|uniref:HEAT repeat domain-containing protein n=1 Tax=Limnochorda sp. TaxID=1940279 RepID=UPI0039C474AB